MKSLLATEHIAMLAMTDTTRHDNIKKPTVPNLIEQVVMHAVGQSAAGPGTDSAKRRRRESNPPPLAIPHGENACTRWPTYSGTYSGKVSC